MKFRQSMLLMSFGFVPAVAMADLSANVGMVSDYVFRGIFQSASSAFAGIDYEDDSGFYIGAWGADVSDGLETDLYFGYGSEVGDITWGFGFTGYYYTDSFDDTYTELNLSLGYGMFSLDVALGDYDIPDPTGDDYTFISLTFELPAGPYFTYASFGDEFTGDYIEVGYGFEWQGVDLSIAYITSDDLAVSQGDPMHPKADHTLVFGISKSFALGE